MKATQHERFRLRRLDDLMAALQKLGLNVPVDSDVSVLGTPLAIGPATAPNRFAVHPMEGFDAGPDGGPSELSFRRYRRYAIGGFGLVWMEATAVLHEARSNPDQLYIHEGSADAFARLVDAVRKTAQREHGQDIVLILQLTHSGRYSRPDGIPAPIIAQHNAILDPKHGLTPDHPLITDDELDRLQDVYVNAARLAANTGFDGVDIKSCHRYLISELLGSFEREGKYGGSFENRTRFLRETMARVQQEVRGPFVTTRMNAYDAIKHPYGFGVDKKDPRIPDLTEPVELARRLVFELSIPILNASVGNPYFESHIGRPYDFPSSDVPAPNEHPLAGIERFMRITRTLQESIPDVPVVGGGYSWLRQFIPETAAGALNSRGASLIGLGRTAFAYPDAPRDILTGGTLDPARCCITCSACTQIMRDGGHTGCVVRDSAIYGPEYRRARRFAIDRLKEEARRCRQCDIPTCAAGCPAQVDIPAFLKAFAEDDIKTAYGILRQRNLLPEMCGYVCPSEVQCEGGCLETVFCENPIPIRDIQLVVCRTARRLGLVGARVPDKTSGQSVAVVGGGPAGIASAVRLAELGHTVSILERSARLGGVPESAIPADRFPEAGSEIEAVLQPALDAGRIGFEFGVELGEGLTVDSLRTRYDAVLLAFGLNGVAAGERAEGVLDALEFLARAKAGQISEIPRSVAVLGGGNTAIDAAVTARRLGVQDVYLMYRRSFDEMPAWPSERHRLLQGGIHCLILTQPIGYTTNGDGHLSGVRIVRTELGDPDASGRRRPVPVLDSENLLAVDLAVEAFGQEVPASVRDALGHVRFTENGLIETVGPESLATHAHGVFAAGDLVNGGTTAVQGIAEGMRAADEIDRFLRS